MNELRDKRKRAREISSLLKEDSARWSMVRREIADLKKQYDKQQARRTKIAAVTDEPEFTADDFIVDEDNQVIVTTDGWIKRQKDIRDPSHTRLREGDSVLAAEAGSTRATVVFLSNFGIAYSSRIIDVPATTGYGEPIQKLFNLRDGEKIVAAFSLDPRAIGPCRANPRKPDAPPKVHAVAASSDGNALRFGLQAFAEPSTRSGRRFARPAKGAQVVGVEVVRGSETIIAASRKARAILCPLKEINYLAGPGKGVKLIRLAKDDWLLGFKASEGDRDLVTVETNRGAHKTISTAKYEITSRGGKGRAIQKSGELKRILPELPGVPVLLD